MCFTCKSIKLEELLYSNFSVSLTRNENQPDLKALNFKTSTEYLCELKLIKNKQESDKIYKQLCPGQSLTGSGLFLYQIVPLK